MAVFGAGRPFFGGKKFIFQKTEGTGSDRGQTPCASYFIERLVRMKPRYLWGQTPWPSGGARKPVLLKKRTEVLRRSGGDGLAGEVSERSVEGFREVELPRVEKL